jgi:hypothetical protein
LSVDNPDTRSPGPAPESGPGPGRLIPAHEFSLYDLDGPDSAAAMRTSPQFSATQYSRYKYAAAAAADAFARALGEAFCACRPELVRVPRLLITSSPYTYVPTAATALAHRAGPPPAAGPDGGDGELRGARRLGLRTVLVERGLPHTRSARADADLYCGDLAEAGRALLSGGKPAVKQAAIYGQHLLQIMPG